MNGNRFYVQPAGDITQGLQGLSQVIQGVGEKRRVDAMNQAAVEAYQSGDPDRIAEVSLQYPEIGQFLTQQGMFRSERTKQNFLDSAYSVLADPSEENISRVVSARQALLRSQGQTDEDMPFTNNFLQKYQENPEQAINELKMDVAGLDPERWKSFRESLSPIVSKNAPTPTDVDDFVSDANAENLRVTGNELTPGQRNEARLQFKRAQEREVRANRMAEREVDAETAERIKYNEKLGSRLAEIATQGDLMKAAGEISPAQKQGVAKKRMEGNLAKLANHYIALDSTGAMLNVDNTTFENVMAAARSSKVGQMFGRITGSNEQSIRSAIKKLKPLLIQDIRQSTDMGTRGLDSEKELEFYLQAATDEKTDIQSNIAAIVVLDEAFGTGNVANQLRNMTNESIISRISEKGQLILNGVSEKALQKNTDEMTDEELEAIAFGRQ